MEVIHLYIPTMQCIIILWLHFRVYNYSKAESETELCCCCCNYSQAWIDYSAALKLQNRKDWAVQLWHSKESRSMINLCSSLSTLSSIAGCKWFDSMCWWRNPMVCFALFCAYSSLDRVFKVKSKYNQKMIHLKVWRDSQPKTKWYRCVDTRWGIAWLSKIEMTEIYIVFKV